MGDLRSRLEDPVGQGEGETALEPSGRWEREPRPYLGWCGVGWLARTHAGHWTLSTGQWKLSNDYCKVGVGRDMHLGMHLEPYWEPCHERAYGSKSSK